MIENFISNFITFSTLKICKAKIYIVNKDSIDKIKRVHVKIELQTFLVISTKLIVFKTQIIYIYTYL
jgi:hypothetical protein